MKRGQHADGGMQPGRYVDQRHAGFDRLPVRATGHAHQSTQRGNHQVIAGPILVRPTLPECGNRAVDQARIRLFQFFVTKAKTIHYARPETLDNHIRVGDQPPGDLYAVGGLQIDCDTASIAVQPQEIGADFAYERRPPAAAVVAGSGPFDLDHVRTEIAEYRRRVRTCHHAREIDHAQSLQASFLIHGDLPSVSSFIQIRQRRSGRQFSAGINKSAQQRQFLRCGRIRARPRRHA